jgi:uncharacterized protein YxeA
MKRTLIEVFLAIALIGASVFGWMNWKQNGAAAPQITELKAAAEEAEKTAKTSSKRLKKRWRLCAKRWRRWRAKFSS